MIPVITIDGPGGTGKGTIGHLLAQNLGWHYLDSGALYRVLAYAAIKQGIQFDNEAELAKLAADLPIKFVERDSRSVVLLEGRDITEAIRGEEIGTGASRAGVWPAVRQALLQCQRDFRQPPGLVTDGRDMGTIVFPDAPLKIFLQASPEERAKRRYHQLKGKGINVSLDALCSELIERDLRDQQRQAAPLRPAMDAIIIDTTHLSIDEALRQVQAEAGKAFSLHKR